LGDLEVGRQRLKKALPLAESKLGKRHPGTACGQDALGVVLRDLGELKPARTVLERALGIDQAVHARSMQVVQHMKHIAQCQQEMSDFSGARAFYEHALAIEESTCGAQHFRVAKTRANLAALLSLPGEMEADRLGYEKALEIFSAALPPRHPKILSIRQAIESLDRE